MKRIMPQRLGFTVIELLVVIGIIGVLTSLLFVAIQSVRESARTVSCSSKLSQIGLAASNFESTHGNLPVGPWIVELMPLMEMEGVIKQLGQNQVASAVQITCPSDGNNLIPKQHMYSNYLGNSGAWISNQGYNGVIGIDVLDGESSRGIRFSDVVDGLSNTALAGEALTASEQIGQVRLRVLWSSPGQQYMLEELEEFASACQGIPSNPIESGWQGNPIIKGNFFRDGAYVVGMAATLYNHVVPPQNPSCTNSGNVGSAISTLTSNHNGIVNVVYCDGHVSNVSENIDVATWREIGNRRDNTNNQ